MNVLLIGNYPPDRQESMQRFARMLVAELPAHGVTVELLRPQPFFNAGRRARGFGKYLGYLDKFVDLSVASAEEEEAREELLTLQTDIEKADAQYMFEVGDCLRYRGLRHCKLSSCLGHAAQLHDGRKDVEVTYPEAATETTFPFHRYGRHRCHLYGSSQNAHSHLYARALAFQSSKWNSLAPSAMHQGR